MQKITFLIIILSISAQTTQSGQSCINTIRRYGANSHIFNANVYCTYYNNNTCPGCCPPLNDADCKEAQKENPSASIRQTEREQTKKSK